MGSPAAWKLYMSLVSVALFVLPALIISACYAVILRTIWAKGAILGHSGEFTTPYRPFTTWTHWLRGTWEVEEEVGVSIPSIRSLIAH